MLRAKVKLKRTKMIKDGKYIFIEDRNGLTDITLDDEVIIVTKTPSVKIVSEVKEDTVVVEQYNLTSCGISEDFIIKEYPWDCVIGVGKSLFLRIRN